MHGHTNIKYVHIFVCVLQQPTSIRISLTVILYLCVLCLYRTLQNFFYALSQIVSHIFKAFKVFTFASLRYAILNRHCRGKTKLRLISCKYSTTTLSNRTQFLGMLYFGIKIINPSKILSCDHSPFMTIRIFQSLALINFLKVLTEWEAGWTPKYCLTEPKKNQELISLLANKINPINSALNPICHLLALLGAHHILHVSRISVNVLSFSTFLY